MDRPACDRARASARLQRRWRCAPRAPAGTLHALRAAGDAAMVSLVSSRSRHATPGVSARRCGLVEQFRYQAAIAIQNLKRAESFRARMLTAERKHAMAELARSVSHDVNNALGSMLPLVQQMPRRPAVRQGRSRLCTAQDLAQIERSLQVCRRIFGGMLSFARGNSRRVRHGQVRPAVDPALGDSPGRHGASRYPAPRSTSLPRPGRRSHVARAISSRSFSIC